MKLYTKTGDDGTTGLFGGGRVEKDDPRVEAYGTVDEANATIGLARAAGMSDAVDALLSAIQSDLFTIGAELATLAGNEDKLKMRLVDEDDIRRLEQSIDETEAELTPLRSFVLPSGHPAGAALHAARTVCRRAERGIIAARRTGAIREQVVVYMNRLSDLLFVLARRVNREAGVEDVPWKPRG